MGRPTILGKMAAGKLVPANPHLTNLVLQCQRSKRKRERRRRRKKRRDCLFVRGRKKKKAGMGGKGKEDIGGRDCKKSMERRERKKKRAERNESMTFVSLLALHVPGSIITYNRWCCVSHCASPTPLQRSQSTTFFCSAIERRSYADTRGSFVVVNVRRWMARRLFFSF